MEKDGILCGLKEIAAAFGTSPKIIRKWRKAGAPIFRKDGRYRTHTWALWQWYCVNRDKGQE